MMTQSTGMEIAVLILGIGAVSMLGFVLWLHRFRRNSLKPSAPAR